MESRRSIWRVSATQASDCLVLFFAIFYIVIKIFSLPFYLISYGNFASCLNIFIFPC